MLKAWCKDCGSTDIGVGERRGRPGEYYYEYRSSRSYKFWAVKREGYRVWMRFGRIGTEGTVQVKDFDSCNEAGFYMNARIHEKLEDGYERAE